MFSLINSRDNLRHVCFFFVVIECTLNLVDICALDGFRDLQVNWLAKMDTS